MRATALGFVFLLVAVGPLAAGPRFDDDGVLKVHRPHPVSAATAQAQSAGALTDGEYGCYTYHPNAVLVGVLTISGSSYRTRTGASGRYRVTGDRVEWQGPAPMGFALAVIEERTKLRMYIAAGDVGNKWKAALCSLRGGS